MIKKWGLNLKKLLLKGRRFPLIAFVLMIILIGGFSFKISTEVYNISQVINEFYEHPYNVRSAVHEFQIYADEITNIWSGHNGDKYLVSNIENIIRQKYELLDRTYLIIENQYLGPKEDPKALMDSYSSLKSYIRTKGFDAALINHNESVHEEINLLLSNIVFDLSIIEKYAKNKADSFRINSSLEEERLFNSLIQFYIVIVLFFILSAIIVGYIISSKDGFIFNEKEKFNKSIEDAPIPIMIHKNGKVLQLSKEWNRISGYSIQDIPTIEEWSRQAYGEKHIPSKEFIVNLYKLENAQDDGIWPIKTKSGEERIWRFHSGPLGDNTVISTAVDVTEEVKSEELIKELHKKTLKLAKAVDQSPVSIVITDTKGNIEYVNDYFTEITGYSSNEAIGNNLRVLKSGIHSKSFYKKLWDTISSGKNWAGEMQNIAKDGTVFWESVSISPIFDKKENIINYVAVKENITQKKELFEQIELSEKLKTSVIDTISEGLVFQDKSAKIILANQSACDILGLTMNQLLGVSSYHPSWSAKNSNGEPLKGEYHPAVIALKTGQRIDDFIMEVNTGENVKKTISINSRPQKDENGNINGVVTTFRDITEKEGMIESIRYNEKFKDSILSAMKEGIIVQDNSYNTLLANISACEIFEMSLDQIKKVGPWDDGWQALSIDGNEIPNEDFPVIKAISNGISVDNFIMNLKMSDNKRKILSISSRPILDDNGEVIQAVSSFRDITELIESNLALVSSEKKYRDLFELTADPSMIEKDGIIIDANKAAVELFKYSNLDDLKGISIADLSPKYQPDGSVSVDHIPEIHKVLNQKGHYRFEWTHIKSDGVTFPSEIMLTKFSDKEIPFLHIIIRDTSIRKKNEQIILDQLEEKEVLLSEVHHRVKNNLAVISGMLELQAFSSKNKKEIEELAKSVYRIKAIAIIHEQLYKTGNFASISIDESIVTQTESLVKMYDGKGKKIEILYDLDNITLNVNQAIPFGLLLNELLTNSLKYAFEGIQKPELKLSLQMLSESIQFTFQDNGIGFDVSKFKNSEETLGRSLIEAFRAQLEGNLDIKSGSKGTIITLSFSPTKKKGASVNYEIKGS